YRKNFSNINPSDIKHFCQELKGIEFKNYSLELKKIFENLELKITELISSENDRYQTNEVLIKNQFLEFLKKDLIAETEKILNEINIKKSNLLKDLESIFAKEEELFKQISGYLKEVSEIQKIYPKNIFDKTEEYVTQINTMNSMFILNPKKYSLKSKLKVELGNELNLDFILLKKWSSLKVDFEKIINFIPYKETKNVYLSEIEYQKIKSEIKIKKLEEIIEKVKNKVEINFEDYPENSILFEISYLINKYQNNFDFIKNIYEVKFDLENFRYYQTLENGHLFQNFKNKSLENLKLKESKIINIELISNKLNILKNIEIENLKDELKKVEIVLSYLKNDYENISEELEKINNLYNALQCEFNKFDLKALFLDDGIYELKKDIFYNKNEDKIINFANDLEINSISITLHDTLKSSLSKINLELYNHILNLDSNTDLIKYIEEIINTFYLKWIDEELDGNQQFLYTITNYEDIKKKIIKLMKEKKENIPNYILNYLNQKIKNRFKISVTGNDTYYNDILKETSRKKGLMPLRKFISTFSDSGIFDIFPCWLLSPEVVSEILPKTQGIFDLVIFDEASQLLVEKGIPAIYRGKNIVVAGDDKQLQPNSLGMKNIGNVDSDYEDEETTEENDYNYEDTTSLSEKSLLDISKLRFASCQLNFHYRSKFEELINFSNFAFYNGELQTPPNMKNSSEEPPIKWIKTNGIWKDRTNREEAEEVYKLVYDILKNRTQKESIGIITFNSNQQDFIREYLEEQSMKNIEFGTLYTKEISRYEDSEDKSLFVKNIENVQGDERDIIIFSIAYAKGLDGKMKFNFGSLTQKGGENRLNVAISRAKQKIYIVTSIEPEELIVEDLKNMGPKLLKKYLQYTRAVSLNLKEVAKDILNSLSVKTKEFNEVDIFDSPFEEQVCNALRKINTEYEIHTQVGDSGYKIDLGIFDSKTSSYILGIECDGATYHSMPSARERDIYRQKFLESKGWKIHRIWSTNWWNNPEVEIKKIIEKL
ncbi:MAG: AAA domain-containing protein, partial [Fusobacteriaceae bacterium]